MTRTLSLPRGTTTGFVLQANDRNGNPVTGLLAGDTLSAVLWAGEDQPALANPTVAWVSATAGTYSVSFVDADTASLVPGTYELRVSVSRTTGQTVPLGIFPFELTYSPGSAVAPPVYCSYLDMLHYQSSLGDVQKNTGDLTGFLEQRGIARRDFDLWIWERRYRPLPGFTRVRSKSAFDGTTGYDAFVPAQSTPPDRYTVKGYLDTNKLLVDQDVIEINARMAIALVFERQATLGGDRNNFYFEAAQIHRRRAADVMRGYRARIDIAATGVEQLIIDTNATFVVA